MHSGIIDDDVIYGQIDNLVEPSYDIVQKRPYHTVIFIRDRYINNIIIDGYKGIYSPTSVNIGEIQLTVVLPHDVNIQEHYYVHFLSMNTTDQLKLDVTFVIEDPTAHDYNCKHIWQKRKYTKLTGIRGTYTGDLYLFVKDANPGSTIANDIELRDYRQAILHKIIDV